ncbi:gasdermin-A isoform X1 [Python bivittatus]|uniref:Gasdermin-A isoform X1 n=1 Tax=Python bivittatus TaxID=176946 RepID=A0A9F5MZJ6_PYTBI|nr:gasdermin-A isoform X1 [Python bivittatus]
MSFHNATKSLAKLMDSRGDWVPVPSMIDHNNFRPLCLLQRKVKTSWWQSCSYHKTECKLCHILLPENDISNLVCQNSELFTLEDSSDGTLSGDISGITDAEVTSILRISHERCVKVKKIHVPIQDLDSLIKEMKINNDHPFIKQTKKLQRNLYVITESAETVEEATFGESNKVESSIFYKAYVRLRLKGAQDKKKTVTIPKGCILAFKAKKLLIGDGTLSISYYSSDKTGTFEKKIFSTDAAVGIGKAQYRQIVKDNRKNLRREVENEYAPLSSMSSNLCGKFLTSFVVLMKKNYLLGELELQLEQALEDPEQFRLNTDKPELKDLMKNLQDVKGAIITELAEATLYFLQALDELTELQIMLLVESVEKNIVSQQLKLVGSILDKYFWDGKQNFTVEVQLLTEEEWDITGVLIEEISGISIRRSGCTVDGSVYPAALSALPALYVALYATDLLSKKSF